MKNIYKINGLRIQFGRLPAGLPALLFIIAALFATPVSTSAQSGLCDPTVPFFTVDLTASPNATWTSPVIVRTDNCCGTTSPDRCLEFEITVNPGTIAINFDIASGAVPPGAMFYQIDCGPPVAVGTPICLTGTGPFTLTFCKPGNNPNTYAVTAIPEPLVGPPVYASSTCPSSIWVQGLVPGTITWTDVTGGGIYNSYLSCTTCASPVVTPAAGHPAYVDYVVCGTIAAGACNGSSSFCDTVRVNMFDPIAATVNPNPAFFCPSDPGVQLTGSHTGGFGNVVYTWYNSSWAAVGSGTGYFATAAGTYYLVVTDDMSASCPADTVPVVVSQYIPPILISPNYAGICEGSSVTLTASGADSYVWAPTAGLSPSTGPVVVASPATTTTYTVTGTDSHGCTGSMSVLIDIFPLPAIEAGPDQEICLGESAQLQGSGAFSYEWTPAGTLNNPDISNPIATPTVTTTYYLTGYSIGGNLIYNGNFELGNTGFTTDYNYDPNLFPEGNYYITNNPNSHHTNFAPCADHTPAPGTQMMVVNGAPNANEEVWCMNVAVVPNTDYAFSTWITSVHPTNPAVLQFSINSVLLGSPFTATSTTCNWQQFYEIWNSGATTAAQICIVNQNIIRNGNDFALDDIGFAPLCSNVDSVTVTVNPNPVVTITPVNPQICQGESTTLTASSDVPGTTFVWSNGATTPSITVSPATTTNYSVTGTADGCTGSASMSVIVNPNPVLTVNASSAAICLGDPTTITVTSTVAGTTYEWSTGATSPSITVSPAATTTYYVTGTTASGCTGTASIQIIVNPLPVITVAASDASICVGESSTLTATSDIPGSTFLWSNGGNTASISVSPVATTTYNVTVTSPQGCVTTGSVTVTVFPNPVLTVTASDGAICFGESSTLTVSSNLPATTFVWSTGQTTTSITVNPTTTTTYIVTGTAANGCTGTASIQIIVNPLPVITVDASDASICVGESSVLTATSDIPGSTFLWSNGGNTASITVSPVATTTYNVTVTSPQGCVTTGSAIVNVFPNPVLTVTASDGAICFGDPSTLTVTSSLPATTLVWSTGETTTSITVNPTTTTTYFVSGTALNGCTGSTSIQIIVNPLPVITVAASDANICVGESSVLTATSDIPGSTFLWSTGANTASITVSPVATTTYNVTVTSPQGCVTTGSVTVTVFPNPVLTATASDGDICFGDPSTLTVTSNLPATSFEWSTGETTASITVNPATTTTYTVTGTAANGCTGTASIQIIVNPLPVITVAASDANICVGESSVLTSTSDIPGSTFLWSNGANTVSITVSPVATTTYNVTVTSPEGCVTTGSVTIIVFPNPVLTVTASEGAICFGDPSTLTVTSNLPATTFEWSNGENGSSVTVSPTATTTYIVTGTAANGCTGTASIQIIVNPLPVITVAASDANICVGESSTLTATSDIPGSSFLWNNGANTASITVSPVATTTYNVTVTSPEGCVTTGSVTITVFPNPVLTVTASAGAICFGDPSTLTVTSNLPATTFEWSTGQTTASITVSPAATTTYIVTGTAANGCTGTASIQIIVNPLPVITVAASDANICVGESSVLTATSDIPGSSFMWSNGANTASITVSPVATTTYNVTVTSPEGCFTTGSVTITVFPNPVLTVTASAGAICFGDPSTLTVTSNLPATTFEWSTGQTTASITVSPAATTTYIVTGTAANGCTGTASIQIIVNPLPVITVAASDANICVGESSTLTATSDIPGSSFLWSTGANTASITVSPVATTTYNVTVTSPEGCVTTGSVTVTVFPNPVLAVNASSGAICFGNPTTINVTSSLPGTTYIWSTGETTAAITVSPTATTTYIVTGTAANGCTGTASIQITVNPLPVITVAASDANICVGESSVLTATSDIPGSTFLWSNGGNTAVITVAPVATTTYNVTVTSPEGCVTTGSVTINVFPNPVLTVTSTATEICNGATATISVSSSVAGTTYEWSTGSTNASISVGPGNTTTYSVTGTAANGCTGTASIQIIVNPLPVVTMTVSDSVICDGESVTLTAASDIAGSSFIWSTGAVTPQIIVTPNLTNTYYLTVTSPEGCTSTANTTITVNPNPIASIVASSGAICLGSTATLTANTNIAVSSYLWNTAETNPTINVTPATTSIYNVTVTTAEGCSGTADISILVNPLPGISVTAPTAAICLGSSVDLTANSNHPSTTYLWNTGQTTTTINVAPAATSTYTVTGTDGNGCTGTAEFLVTVNPLPEVDIVAAQNQICQGMSVQLTASSNIPNTNYEWNTGQNTQSIIVSPSANTTYEVTGTDANGCTGSNRITIQVNPNPTVVISPNSYTICPGDTATLNASSSMAVSYEWNTGATTSSISVWPTATTNYSVTGTDNNGCKGVASATIVVRNAPVITVSPYNPKICHGDSVTLIATGAVLYDWTPATGLNTNVGNIVISSPDSTITYTVAGVDLYGCLGSSNITVTVHPIPTVDFRADETDICQATVVHFTGMASPSIQSWVWDFGDPAAGASNSSSMQNPMHAYFETGTYTVGLSVTTTAGCKNSIQKPSYIIVHPNPIASFARTPDITTLEYPTIQFYDQSLGEKTRLWDFDDPGSGLDNNSITKNPTHTYSAEGEYWATLFVENEWGCMDSVSNRIIINPTWDEYIPTAFSPNGDGNNDIFRPMGFNIDFTQYKMYIYDRWGKEIFDTDNIEEGWDGRVNDHGETVQQDVYVYLIILTDITGLEHQFIGHVTVVK